MNLIFEIRRRLLCAVEDKRMLSCAHGFDLRMPWILFRGVSSMSFRLVASVAREKKKVDVLAVEKIMLNEFSAQVSLGSLSEWERLSIAQHYGMKTRLLDWTSNPFVAMYFASREREHEDGRIYGLLTSSSIFERNERVRGPFPRKGKHDGTMIFRPFVKSARIISQSGYLMRQVYEQGRICPVDENEVFKGRVFSIDINASEKCRIIEELASCKITECTLNPYDALLERSCLNVAQVEKIVDKINRKYLP